MLVCKDIMLGKRTMKLNQQLLLHNPDARRIYCRAAVLDNIGFR